MAGRSAELQVRLTNGHRKERPEDTSNTVHFYTASVHYLHMAQEVYLS